MFLSGIIDDYEVEVLLGLPEMDVVDWAKLVEIGNETIGQSGPGNVVTGTFAHIADSVIDLLIEDQPKPIGCTSNHPFWSVDRHDFVESGDLQEDERVLLYNGDTKRVVSKLPRPGPQTVYNLEVYSEHVYHVTLDGVLVHNNCDEPPYLGKGRPYLREDTKKQIIAAYINKGGCLPENPWVFGHREGFEYWRLKRWALDNNLSREAWNKLHNNPLLYQIEDAAINASHINEDKSEYKDMTKKLKNYWGQSLLGI